VQRFPGAKQVLPAPAHPPAVEMHAVPPAAAPSVDQSRAAAGHHEPGQWTQPPPPPPAPARSPRFDQLPPAQLAHHAAPAPPASGAYNNRAAFGADIAPLKSKHTHTHV